MKIPFTRKVLSIQAKEEKRFYFLFCLSFLSGIPQIASLTAAGSLVINRFPPEILPQLMILTGLVLAVVSSVLVLFMSNRGPKTRLLTISLLLFITSTLTVFLSYVKFRWPGIAVLAYLMSRLENVYLSVLFLIALNSLFSPRAMRRVVGVGASGQVISLTIGGALIPFFVKNFDPSRLLVFSMIAHGLIFVLIFFTFPPTTDSKPVNRKYQKTSFSVWIFLLIAVMYLVYYNAETIFLGGLNQFAGTIDKAVFISRFWIVVGMSALFLKSIFAGRFFNRFGLLGGLLAAPALLGGLFFLAAGVRLESSMYLWLVVIIKGLERLLDGSLFLPAYYGLFKALPERSQIRSQVFAESLVGQMVAVAVGLLLLVGGQGRNFNLLYLYVLGGVLCILWLLLSVRTHYKYKMEMDAITAPPEIRFPEGRQKEVAVGEQSKITNEEQDDRIISRLLFGWTILKKLRPVEWLPLVDAFLWEDRANVEKLFKLMDHQRGEKNLEERLYRLYGLDEAEYQKALEGLMPLVPLRYREILFSLLEREEDFLIQQAFDRLKKGGGWSDGIREPAFSNWTTTLMLADSKTQKDEWEQEKQSLLALKRSEIFSAVPLPYLDRLTSRLQQCRFNPGEKLIRQDEPGESLFILIEGTVQVLADDKELAVLRKGACFGELSAIVPEKRNATIAALSSVETIMMERSTFHEFLVTNLEVVKILQRVLERRLFVLAGNIPYSPFRAEILSGVPENVGKVSAENFTERLGTGPAATILAEQAGVFALNSVMFRHDSYEYWILPEKMSEGLLYVVNGEVREYWDNRMVKTHLSGNIINTVQITSPKELVISLKCVKETEFLWITQDAVMLLLNENIPFQILLLENLVTYNRLMVKRQKD